MAGYDFFSELTRASQMFSASAVKDDEPEVTVLRFSTDEQRMKAAMTILVKGELKVRLSSNCDAEDKQ